MSRYLSFVRAQWDRVLGWALVAGGGGLVVTGALNVSRAPDQLDQLSYLASGPAIGLFLLGVGAVLLLTADLRDEWAKLDEVAALLRPPGGGEPPDPDGGGRPVDLRADPVGVVAIVAAGAGIGGGAFGARQALERASAARWTGLSGASLALAVAAAAFIYLRSRQAVSSRVAAALGAGSGPAPGRSGPDPAPDGGDRYVVEGSALAHRAGCDLLGFAEAAPIPAARAAEMGLGSCPLCR
ncbi:MAG TPA: hypothetical protein VHL53_00430 [Acidimicrobiia bacterium]|nr:hypothetical protein [Acidimicrobiia bacterium]